MSTKALNKTMMKTRSKRKNQRNKIKTNTTKERKGRKLRRINRSNKRKQMEIRRISRAMINSQPTMLCLRSYPRAKNSVLLKSLSKTKRIGMSNQTNRRMWIKLRRILSKKSNQKQREKQKQTMKQMFNLRKKTCTLRTKRRNQRKRRRIRKTRTSPRRIHTRSKIKWKEEKTKRRTMSGKDQAKTRSKRQSNLPNSINKLPQVFSIKKERESKPSTSIKLQPCQIKTPRRPPIHLATPNKPTTSMKLGHPDILKRSGSLNGKNL